MLYEIAIGLISVAVSFVLYFSFFKYFQFDRQSNESNDEIIFDKRTDLIDKELLYVSVVRDSGF